MNKRETDTHQFLEIIERKSISEEVEVMLVKDRAYDQTIYQVSLCVTRLEKPCYGNMLFKLFTDREQALELYENLCSLRGQDEMAKVVLSTGKVKGGNDE